MRNSAIFFISLFILSFFSLNASGQAGDYQIQFLDPTPEQGSRIPPHWRADFRCQIYNPDSTLLVFNFKTVIMTPDQTDPEVAIQENEVYAEGTSYPTYREEYLFRERTRTFYQQTRYAYKVFIYAEDGETLLDESPAHYFYGPWTVHAFRISNANITFNTDTLFHTNPDSLAGIAYADWKDTLAYAPFSGIEVYDPSLAKNWYLVRGLVKMYLPETDTLYLEANDQKVSVTYDSLKASRSGAYAFGAFSLENPFYEWGSDLEYYSSASDTFHSIRMYPTESYAFNSLEYKEVVPKDSFALAGFPGWKVVMNGLSCNYYKTETDSAVEINNQVDIYAPLPLSGAEEQLVKVHSEANFLSSEFFLEKSGDLPALYPASDSSTVFSISDYVIDLSTTVSASENLPADWKGLYLKEVALSQQDVNGWMKGFELLADSSNSQMYLDANGLQMEAAIAFVDQPIFLSDEGYEGQWDSLKITMVDGVLTEYFLKGQLTNYPEALATTLASDAVYLDLLQGDDAKLMLEEYEGGEQEFPLVRISAVNYEGFRFDILHQEDGNYELEMALDQAFTDLLSGYDKWLTSSMVDSTQEAMYFEVDSLESAQSYFVRLKNSEQTYPFVWAVETQENKPLSEPVLIDAKHKYWDEALEIVWQVSDYGKTERAYVQRKSESEQEFQTLGQVEPSLQLSYIDESVVENEAYSYRLAVYGTEGSANSAPSDYIAVSFILSSEDASLSEVKFYPNPVSDWFYIEGLEVGESVKLELFSLEGQRMMHTSFEYLQKHKVALKGIPSGVYLMKISSERKEWKYRIMKK